MDSHIWILWILSIWVCYSYQYSSVPPNHKTCPYPLPKTIAPCTCTLDEKFQVHLSCVLQDMDTGIMRKLTEAFALNTNIYMFSIQAKWTADLALLGKFNVTKFHLTKGGPMEVDLAPGAFNEAIEEVYIDTNRDFLNSSQSVSILTGTFSNLPNLKNLTLKGEFGKIQTKAFSNLPKVADINLSGNGIKKLEDNTFDNLPGLVNIDLSDNIDLCHIGNLLYHQDLTVNLDNTNVNIVLEDAFKHYLESVIAKKGKGYVSIGGVKLQCGCDITWLAKLDVSEWKEIIKNGLCSDGTKLEKVDFGIHIERCPPDHSPGYDAGYGQMYPKLLPSEDSGIVTTSELKKSGHRWTDISKTYEINTHSGPVEMSFSAFLINKGSLIIKDKDGTVLMEKKWEDDANSAPGNITSNTNNVIVDFSTRPHYRAGGRSDRYYTTDGFTLHYQGAGGFVTDRKKFCECCD